MLMTSKDTTIVQAMETLSTQTLSVIYDQKQKNTVDFLPCFSTKSYKRKWHINWNVSKWENQEEANMPFAFKNSILFFCNVWDKEIDPNITRLEDLFVFVNVIGYLSPKLGHHWLQLYSPPL